MEDNSYTGNLTELAEGESVEYYITATDAFDKSTDALNGSDYFSFVVGVVVVPPFPLVPALIAVGVMLAAGVVIVWYMFVYKKK